MKRSKRYKALKSKIPPEKFYKTEEAVVMIKDMATLKFDETIEISLKLGIDPKKDNIRGTVVLPHGTGKTKKVAVIAKGEKLKEAQDSGADIAGSEDLIEKISKGFLDFDVLVATPDMMRDLGKLGKLLGPKGLMPSPKAGTVTFELNSAIKNIKAGQVEYKIDATGNIKLGIGKASFDNNKIRDNINMLIYTILKAKPSSAKGQYLQAVTISTTMSPGVKIDPSQKFSV